MPVEVEVVGIKDVLKGLTFIDENLYNKVRSAINPLMKNVESKAKGFVPSNNDVLSGWSKPISSDAKYRPFPKYDQANVKGGIGFKEGKNRRFNNGFQVESYVYNVSAAGRIYETAGRLNPQGRAPFTQIDPSSPGTSFGPTQGFEGFKRGRGYKYIGSTRVYGSNNPFAGYQFVTDLPGLTSQPRVKGVRGASSRKTKGRLIYKAWAEESPAIYGAIVKAVNAVATHFNKTTEKKVA